MRITLSPMKFLKCLFRMIGPFVDNIFNGWMTCGVLIPLTSSLLTRTTFVRSSTLFIGVVKLLASTLLVLIGPATIVGLMPLSAL